MIKRDKMTIEYNPKVLAYIEERLREKSDFKEKRFISVPGGETMSAEDTLREIKNKTEIGIRLYEAVEWLYSKE